MYRFILGLLSLFLTTIISAQELRQPFDFPILLSGSFGELRNNHFHSGIDFKTQGAEGKPVRAVQSGYISRISVSPWGYGLALYLDHPDQTTTVYAHLQRFIPEVAAYVKAQQYAAENFTVNLYPEAGQFSFDAGEVIAYSGNTGSSGGPHLHFEVRDTQTEEVLDPFPFFGSQIRDTRPPRMDEILIAPVAERGIINGKTDKQTFKVTTTADGKSQLNAAITAWGEIGLAVKAYDYMDNTTNIYGVKEVRLSVDDQLIFLSDLDRYAFDETRFLNSFVDYEYWKNKRQFFMRSFVEPGNKLRFIEAMNRGIITIDEERTYRLVYTLYDASGNQSRLVFHIEGKPTEIPVADLTDTTPFHWHGENRFGAKGIRLTVPKGNLYADLAFRYQQDEDSLAFAGTHRLHDKPVALHGSAQLALRIQQDTIENKQQYGIVRIHNGKSSWIGGDYRQGWMDASICEFGNYSIRRDGIAPKITPVGAEQWMAKKRSVLRLSDNLSGVKTYRGEIDGEFVLFEMDNRSFVSYKIDTNRFAKGKHTLRLTATDAAGNEAVYTYDFVL